MALEMCLDSFKVILFLEFIIAVSDHVMCCVIRCILYFSSSIIYNLTKHRTIIRDVCCVCVCVCVCVSIYNIYIYIYIYIKQIKMGVFNFVL